MTTTTPAQPTTRPPRPARSGNPLLVVVAVAAVVAASVLAVLVVSGGNDTSASTIAAVADTDGLTVQGIDGVRPGWTKVTFKNPATDDHGFALARLHDGVTVDAFVAGLETPDGLAALPLADFEGGIDEVLPHTTFTMNVDLPTGHHVLFDHAERPDGTARFNDPAFVRDFVVAGRRTDAGPPKASTAVTMRDFSYQIPATLPGHGVVAVTNEGTQLHMAGMIRLADGVTPKQALEKIRSGGQPAGEELEFIGLLSPGRSMRFGYTLAPGNYVIACFVPDGAHGGVPHVAEGMVATFTVTDRT